MGNIKTKDVGDFQASIGRASSDVGVIGAIVTGVVLSLIGIVLFVLAFVPLSIESNTDCQSDADCKDVEGVGVTCRTDWPRVCTDKRKFWWLILVGVGLFAIAGFTIWYSIWWRKQVHRSRGFAHLSALGTESGLLSSIFSG
jgi:hypothetical protein